MDPITISMLLSLGQPVAMNLIGQLFASGDRAKAEELLTAAAQAFDIPVPDVERMVAEQVGPTALAGVRADPTLVAAQRRGLEGLRAIAEAGGMDPVYRQQMLQAEQAAGGAEAARRASILEGEARRGTAGSGRGLAAQLAGSQRGAQMQQQAQMTAAAEGQRRGLEALRGMTAMAGDIRGQEYSEAARAAQAQDAIDKYNAMLRGQAQGYNLEQPWRQFDARARLAGGKAGALGNLAGFYGGRAAETQQGWGNVGQAAGMGAAMWGQQQVPIYGAGVAGGMADLNPARRRR